MKLTWKSPVLAGLCATALLASRLFAAAPAPTSSKLDKLIAPIAAAAEVHQEGRLMNQALLRQSMHANSVLEARWNDAGAVQVYLHYAADGTPPDLDALKALGATGIVQSDALKVVQAWVPAAELRAASTLTGVSRVGLPRYAMHKRAMPVGPKHETGSVDTQGDTILGATQFRKQTGITGQGISVGVISDGDTHATDSQKSGDLPANIVNDPNDAGSFKSSGDEGTAMMEIIYDLAPGVKQLDFCGPQSTVDFITCLNDFAGESANIVVDDLQFPGSAMFSDDDFNTAVKSFATKHPAIPLITAAGNDALGYWQGTWNSPTPVTLSPALMVNGQSYTQAANFSTNATPVAYLKITLPSSQIVGDTLGYIVEWNDPWSDTTTTNDPNDYDVVVFDNPNADSSGDATHLTGHLAVACNQGFNLSSGTSGVPSTSTVCNQANSKDPTTPGPQPVQGALWVSAQTNYYLEIFLKNGAPGANLKVLVFDETTPFPIEVSPVTAGSVFGHAALPEEITAGAFDAQAPLYSIEPFSALGPVEYGVTDGSSTSVTNPQSIPKPDFAAPDDVFITGAGGFTSSPGGAPTFSGTSAAGPHIAGLMALLMAGYPTRQPLTLLVQASVQPGSPNPNGTFGNGVPVLTNLLTASVLPSPAATISSPTAAVTLTTGQSQAFTGSCSSGSASGTATLDWNFGAGSGVADSTAASPTVMFNTAGSYTVTLKCTNSAGSGTATVAVTVNAPPSKGGGGLDLLALSGLGLIYLVRRRHH